ncbi:MAG: hypothetical protein ACR2N3_14680 [Pyrinomonadaceae bacterium]
MKLKKFSKLASLPLIIFLLAFVSFGQEETSLQIILTDQESALVTQAIIKLKTNDGKSIREINAKRSQDFILGTVKEGEYALEIQAVGFKSLTKNIEIRRGRNVLNIKLEISEIKVDVEVSPEVLERRFEEAFTRNLTVEEIEALPNNPNEIEAELKRKYGDDILIRVNGFTGGRLPPKEMIASIKVIRSSFDAEFHQIGQTIVDVKTKAGLPKIFGFFAFNFNDAAMNARNAFAPERLPARNKFLIAFLGGPIIKKKTSFIASLFAIDSFEKNNIIAVAPDRIIENKAKSGSRIFVPSIGIDHNLSKNHTLHLNYEMEKFDLTNAGVGGFNLPETGYSSKSANHRIRISESGTIRKTYVNEFRLELLESKNSLIPNTRAVSIIVLNAFTAGGAGVDNNSRERRLDLVDNLLFDRGKHSVKIGGEIELERQKSFSANGINGSFTFTSLADYLNNRPATFTRRQGTSRISLNQAQIALYAQDDIRLYRNFQIGLGLRYERQNNLKDSNNFSPRLSFIYSPSREGKIVFRVGAGVFYNWFDTQNLATILNSDGRQASDLIIRNPGYPNAFAGGIISQSLAPSVLKKDENLKSPYIFITQAGFNYRAAKKLNIETFYTFRRGIHQFRSRDINAPIGGIRPNPLFGRIAQVESSGSLTENALEIKLDGSLPKAVTFNTRYRLAKAINDFDGAFDLPEDSYNLNLERGFSGLDRRHYLTGNLNFTLLKKLQVTPIFRVSSPLPYTITTGRDDNRDTVFNDRPAGISRNTERGAWFKQVDLRLGWRVPIAKRGNAASKDKATKNKTSNPQAVAATDFLKNYSIGMDVTIQNIFNWTNLQNFVGNQLSPFYRRATSAASTRQIQVGLNFFF